MKPENIEKNQAKRRKEAVWGAVFFSLLQIAGAVCLWVLSRLPGIPRWLFVLFLTLAVICLALIPPALWILKIRFQEIKGGELDAAGQY